MSEERFFAQVKSTMETFSPEVPQAVYAGMRRRVWWNKFTALDATRFNMWYLLLLVGVGSATAGYHFNGKAVAEKSNNVPQVPALNIAAPVSSAEINTTVEYNESAKTNACSSTVACSKDHGSHTAKSSACAAQGTSPEVAEINTTEVINSEIPASTVVAAAETLTTQEPQAELPKTEPAPKTKTKGTHKLTVPTLENNAPPK